MIPAAANQNMEGSDTPVLGDFAPEEELDVELVELEEVLEEELEPLLREPVLLPLLS